MMISKTVQPLKLFKFTYRSLKITCPIRIAHDNKDILTRNTHKLHSDVPYHQHHDDLQRSEATKNGAIIKPVYQCPGPDHHSHYKHADTNQANDGHNQKGNLFDESVHDIALADETAGVFRHSESDDIKVLVNNFTAPALALALRHRETTLQSAAILAQKGDWSKLTELLTPFLQENVEKRRIRNHGLDFSHGFTRKELIVIQRYLHRLPRQLYQPAPSRASVLIPLCNVSGVASILFERRSAKVRTYKHQACFPGGMLDEGTDITIVQTSLREMEEELGISHEKIEVLGVLRCNWNAVAHVTGIAVTPVVGYIGEVNNLTFKPNSDEVEEYFTVPIENVLNEKMWVHKNMATPIFTGGPHVIWGLTAYLLERFLQDVLLKCSIHD
jgi:nudix motif 8